MSADPAYGRQSINPIELVGDLQEPGKFCSECGENSFFVSEVATRALWMSQRVEFRLPPVYGDAHIYAPTRRTGH